MKHWLTFCGLLLCALLKIVGVEPNPGPSKTICGSCSKTLGKSTKTKPLLWCTICGWVHFDCSGLASVREYDEEDFTCTKCSRERVVSQVMTVNPSFQKAHRHYSDISHSSSAFGNSKSLAKTTGLPVSTVEKYLSTSSTYTKLKQTRRNFPRLKVLSYRLNEIWSIDLADMQSVESFNNGVRYLLVAVETLSRYLRVEPMKDKYATTTKQAFCRMIAKRKGFKNSGIIPERLWADDGKEFLGAFAKYCQSKKIAIYQTYNEKKSAFAERNVRSLKALIYRYMNEHHTERYIDQLQNFVQVINSRTNRVIGMAPKDVTQDHVGYLVSLTLNKDLRKPNFKIGDTVRIRRKLETFHKGYKVQFSQEIFRISAILTKNPPTYRVVSNETNEIIFGRFYESELVKYQEI